MYTKIVTEYHILYVTRAMDTQCDFSASFSYAFFDLVILPTATYLWFPLEASK